MLTSKELNCCSKCKSSKLHFEISLYEEYSSKGGAKETLLGEFYCEECGSLVARKIGKNAYEFF